jgi:hypothetical protein
MLQLMAILRQHIPQCMVILRQHMLHSLIPMLIALIRFAYLLCDCSLICFSFSELQYFLPGLITVVC